MRTKFTIEYKGIAFQFEWDHLDHSVWLNKKNGSKINYGNGKAKNLESANRLAIEMLQSYYN